jgi:hypothetical protein
MAKFPPEKKVAILYKKERRKMFFSKINFGPRFKNIYFATLNGTAKTIERL